MNKRLIAGMALLVFQGSMLVLDHAAKKYAKESAQMTAVNKRSEEETNAMNEALDRCDIFKEMSEREKKESAAQIKAWKAAKEWDKRKNSILSEVDDGLSEFKAQTGYFDAMNELNENYNAGLEAFKKSIDYESEKEKLEKAIKEAEKHYENQKEAFNAAGDDISETTMKLRHAAEEVMEKKVREAKEKIAALDAKVSDETDRLNGIKTEKARNLEEKVSKEKIRLSKKQEKDLEKLNQELDTAKNDIQAKLRMTRSAAENTAVSCHEDDMRVILDQHDQDSKLARDIFNDMPKEEMIAQYLVSKKVPRWAAAAIGMIPVVPVEYLVYRYARFLWNVVKRMADE